MNTVKHIENKGFFIYDDDGREVLAELTYKMNGDILIFDQGNVWTPYLFKRSLRDDDQVENHE